MYTKSTEEEKKDRRRIVECNSKVAWHCTILVCISKQTQGKSRGNPVRSDQILVERYFGRAYWPDDTISASVQCLGWQDFRLIRVDKKRVPRRTRIYHYTPHMVLGRLNLNIGHDFSGRFPSLDNVVDSSVMMRNELYLPFGVGRGYIFNANRTHQYPVADLLVIIGLEPKIANTRE